MPTRSNPIHMDAFPSLYRLMEQAKSMSSDATRKPLTSEQQDQLTHLAIAALKASGVSHFNIETQLNIQFGKFEPVGLKPSPASIETAKSAEPVPATTNEKKGGLFR